MSSVHKACNLQKHRVLRTLWSLVAISLVTSILAGCSNRDSSGARSTPITRDVLSACEVVTNGQASAILGNRATILSAGEQCTYAAGKASFSVYLESGRDIVDQFKTIYSSQRVVKTIDGCSVYWNPLSSGGTLSAFKGLYVLHVTTENAPERIAILVMNDALPRL
jgi:hypothetical protein